MKYQTRNSIVLAVFLAIILSVSAFIVTMHYPRKIHALNAENEKLSAQIASLDGIEQQYDQIEEMILRQEKRLREWDKRVVSSVTPAQTYRYLNEILNHSGVVNFNLYYVEEKSTEQFHYKLFRIKGEGSFSRLFNFVSYLERGPEFYKIDKLSLNLLEEKDAESGKFKILVPFSMELWALHADVSELPPIHRTLGDVRVHSVKNPFYPHIKGNLPPNDQKLVEVERAELKAVMPGKILISDHSGNIHSLKRGAEVYLGYLSRIDVDNNEAEFILNKGGIVEKITLELMFDQKINE